MFIFPDNLLMSTLQLRFSSCTYEIHIKYNKELINRKECSLCLRNRLFLAIKVSLPICAAFLVFCFFAAIKKHLKTKKN